MKSNKYAIDALYDSFFLNQTFDSVQLFNQAKKEVDWVVSSTKLAKGSEVIDVGCGSGRHLRAFLDHNFICKGIDLSKSCIQLAKKKCPEISSDLFEDDFLNFKKNNNKLYDLVFASGATIGYSDEDSVNRDYVLALFSIVKPSGYLVMDFLNSKWAESQFKNRVSFWSETSDYYILDDRKYEKGFLLSKKIFVDKKSGQIRIYEDKVRCYSPDELILQITNFEPSATVISLTAGYANVAIDEKHTPLCVYILKNNN